MSLEPVATDVEGGESPESMEECVSRALRTTRWSCPREQAEIDHEVMVCMFREQPDGR